MIGTLGSYQQISRNLDKSLGMLSLRPEVKRQSDYFLANIRRVKSAEEFLGDDRLYQFAMTAYGLKDMIYAKAFMRKILTEGLENSKSFALQLADTRFREFAEAFNFTRYGATATAFDRAQQGTVDRYVRIQLEADAGQKDEGLRLALYFQRKAPSVSSVYGLMGDPALYKVVQTALGLPAAYSNTDIDKQAAYIASKIAVADFKDEAKLDAFVSRFAARWQAFQGAGAAATTVPLISLAGSGFTAFDSSLLLSLQSVRRGGR